jgi:GNAT superfamily N-acetyltransferase
MTTVITNQEPYIELLCDSNLRLVRPSASDIDAVRDMLSRCSPATLFHRFHGFSDGAAYFDSLLRDGPVDRVVIAQYGLLCVGVAALGFSPTGPMGLGVLVEDAWQRQGIGTRLVTSLLKVARARGSNIVHADVLSEDGFILDMLRSHGSLTVAMQSGNYSVDVRISPFSQCRPG